jgi:predicted glycoside hydrolase/deacetylase ChbG (UPF0249 family)
MILCADDYGISPGVSRGIRQLLARGRLSATSCMVGFPDVEDELRALQAYRESVDIGLHFVLTDHSPLASHSSASGLLDANGRLLSFSQLARRAYRNRLDECAIARELTCQLDRFFEWLGFAPDFIDGHQHVQQLPGVRNALAAVVRTDPRLANVYVRVGQLPRIAPKALASIPSWSTLLGSCAIAFPSRGARGVLAAAGIRTNDCLLGYYPAQRGLAFEAVFAWYASLRPSARDVFSCHPGMMDPVLEVRDSLTSEREEVLGFLASDVFEARLVDSGLVLNRFDDVEGKRVGSRLGLC